MCCYCCSCCCNNICSYSCLCCYCIIVVIVVITLAAIFVHVVIVLLCEVSLLRCHSGWVRSSGHYYSRESREQLSLLFPGVPGTAAKARFAQLKFTQNCSERPGRKSLKIFAQLKKEAWEDCSYGSK